MHNWEANINPNKGGIKWGNSTMLNKSFLHRHKNEPYYCLDSSEMAITILYRPKKLGGGGGGGVCVGGNQIASIEVKRGEG